MTSPRPGRDLEVAPARLERWVAGFHERHGDGPVSRDGDLVVAASGADGSHADFTYFLHDPLGVVLVRRGGYAVGLARDGRFARDEGRDPVRPVPDGGRRLVAATVRTTAR